MGAIGFFYVVIMSIIIVMQHTAKVGLFNRLFIEGLEGLLGDVELVCSLWLAEC